MQAAVLLGLLCYAGHCLDGFDRVGTAGGLAGEHHGIGVLEDGCGDITHLSTRGARVLDHRMQHLSGNDDGLLPEDAFLDEHTLYAWDALCRNLDAQVAAGHHDAVAVVQDFVDIVYALLVLYLRYNLDVGIMLVKNLLHLYQVVL